jgi:hypothetical protein
MTERDLWWTVDCPLCHRALSIRRREKGERCCPSVGSIGCHYCKIGVMLGGLPIYLYDAEAMERVDPTSPELR